MKKYITGFKGYAVIAFLMLIVLLLSGSSIYARLNDFRKDVEREENSSGGSSGEGSSGGSDDVDDCLTDLLSECLGQCLASAFDLWIEVNMPVYYSDYPYSADNKKNSFIYYDPAYNPEGERDCSGLYDEEEEERCEEYNSSLRNSYTPSPELKHYYFTIEGGGDWFRDEGKGFHAALSGKIARFFGPEIEYRRISDGEDYLNYYAIGINIPLFQFDAFAPDFYAQACGMKGVLDRNGFTYGLIIHSYPVDPLVLTFRIGQQAYESIGFLDVEARAGIIINRFEFFCGWRHMKAKYASLGGLVYGVKVYL